MPENDNTASSEESHEQSANQTSTDNMEVHHHAHTPRHSWTHYFWEFFMLFLAVSAGFLAENIREHYVEGLRAKQYASFLYADLIKDTVLLNQRTTFMQTGSKELDTLNALFHSFNESDSSIKKIYAKAAYLYSGVFFSPTTSTLEQLKYSGNLRYFHNSNLVRYFSKYDTDLQRLKAIEERNDYLNMEVRKFLAQFLDMKGITRFIVTASDSSGFILSEPEVPVNAILYKKEKSQFEFGANLCVLKQFDWSTRIGIHYRVLFSARQLISSLKEEYHFE